jgi:hypothetical protein
MSGEPHYPKAEGLRVISRSSSVAISHVYVLELANADLPLSVSEGFTFEFATLGDESKIAPRFLHPCHEPEGDCVLQLSPLTKGASP